jgi:hypothetical protein
VGGWLGDSSCFCSIPESGLVVVGWRSLTSAVVVVEGGGGAAVLGDRVSRAPAGGVD